MENKYRDLSDLPMILRVEDLMPMLQENTLIRIQSALLRGNGVPFLIRERGAAFLAPQTHQTQAAAYGQQPAHGGTGGTILRRAVPHLHIDILREILCIVGVPEVGKCKAVHRRSRALVQRRQRLMFTAGNALQQLLQFAPVLCRCIFGCHQHTEHGLLSPVIRVMHGKDVLLHERKVKFSRLALSFSIPVNVPFVERESCVRYPRFFSSGGIFLLQPGCGMIGAVKITPLTLYHAIRTETL